MNASRRGKLYGRGGLESAIGSKICAGGVMSGQYWIARDGKQCMDSNCLDQGKAVGEITSPSCGFWLRMCHERKRLIFLTAQHKAALQ